MVKVLLLTLFFSACAESEILNSSDSRQTALDLDSVTRGNDKFVFKLFLEVGKQVRGNLVLSPLSVEMVLAQLFFGAVGDTALELASLLSLPNQKQDTLNGYSTLKNLLKDPSLALASKIFVQETAPVKLEFQEISRKYFNSLASSLDFQGAPQASEMYINAWVKERTNKKITDLLAPGTVTVESTILLVNAIHFKANWKTKFLKSETKIKRFYVARKRSTKAEMMHSIGEFGFLYDNTLHASILELKYDRKDFRMFVILPDDISGLRDLVFQLGRRNISKILNSVVSDHVEVQLPKFKIESTIELNDVLESLGVRTMFSERANFSKLTEEPVSVSTIVQKAFIEVDEEGTEAAASTVVEVEGKFEGDSKTKVFIANHPFIFLITFKGIILFAGRVHNIPIK